jgi:ABC-type Fe3+/spermidine/putrescine transport system ATPase subunit
MSDSDLTRQSRSKDSTIEDDRPEVLTVEGMTKVYPDGTLAVDDINFGIKEGDFCVIIGPSGCGKSTTLHSLVGKIPVTEGRVTLADGDITHTPTYRRDIGLVFQDFQLFPHMTVEENIWYGLRRMNISDDDANGRVESVVEMMQLKGMQDRRPEELSAGQKQRVALARSLVLEPKLLLLDEPLGDMDYKLQKRMERELLRIHREFDTTFVYVTHDQTQAMRLADQIVVMNDGKIEQSGPVEEVYNEPNTAFVATFVGDSNIFYGEIVDVDKNGSRAVLKTDFGIFQLSTQNLYSDPTDVVGREMSFAVRPQYLRLGDDYRNTLSCSVDDVIYQSGSGTQLILRTASAASRENEVQLKSDRRLDVETDEVTIGWEADDAILLERTSVVEGIDLETDILGE